MAIAIPMKKLIVCFLILLVSLSAQAQPDYRHEISVSYGRLSNMELYGYGLEQLANITAALTGLVKVHVVSIGSIGVSYFYLLSKVGVKLHWYEREWFRTYSMFAVGALYRNDPVIKQFRVASVGLRVKF